MRVPHGYVLYSVAGSPAVLVTATTAAALDDDMVLCGNAYVRPSGSTVNGQVLYLRVPPQQVHV